MKSKIDILMQMLTKEEVMEFRKSKVSYEDFIQALHKKGRMFFYIFDKQEIRSIYDKLMTNQNELITESKSI